MKEFVVLSMLVLGIQHRLKVHPTGVTTRGWSVRIELLRKSFTIVFAIFILRAAAGAQIPTSGNVFFGYSYSQGEAYTNFGNGGANLNGWEGSVEGKFLPWIGVVADLDWHYGGRTFTGCLPAPCTPRNFRVNVSRHALLFGPRASLSIGRCTPFAELLLGFAHQSDVGGPISNSDTTFSSAVGGGLDYKLIKGVAWRLQGDSIHTHFFGNAQNDLRISTGIVFRF